MCSSNEFGATIVKHFLSAREANIGAQDLKKDKQIRIARNRKEYICPTFDHSPVPKQFSKMKNANE